MPRTKKLILVISRDLGLADVRYRVLVEAGFDVIAATDIRGVAAGAAAKPDAAMIGYSVPAPEKRRIWPELRKHAVPTLELHRDDKVLSAAVGHRAESPDDFLEPLQLLLRVGPAQKAARKGRS